MKDLFKHASSSRVKYNRYEWKKDKNNKFYITPAHERPEALMPRHPKVRPESTYENVND